MRQLRNKKTGEIYDKVNIHVSPWKIGTRGWTSLDYSSVDKFNEEWEDYEEPKDIWWLDNEGHVNHSSGDFSDNFRKNKEIGNYFLSREEAEKAVKKLKAWKRLKDREFKIDLWGYDGDNYQERIKTGRILFRVKDYEENDKDLDLLFGGEE